jgi:hypothetical protein
MYWKIEKSGCCEHKGLVQIRYDCFFDKEDNLYLQYLREDTQEPRPFVCHFRYFNPDVTEEEILSNGDDILSMSYRNLIDGDLRKNSNPPIKLKSDLKITAIEKVDIIKVTDYKSIAEAKLISTEVK